MSASRAGKAIYGICANPFGLHAIVLASRTLRIHDLRHMATTILFLEGIPEAIIRKLTGHRSRELERYEHLSPVLKRQTVERIVSVLASTDTATDTGKSGESEKSLEVVEGNGGDDGA